LVHIVWLSIASLLRSSIKMIEFNVVTHVYRTVGTVAVCMYGSKRMAGGLYSVQVGQ
jgi:hypothetical protein